MKGLNPRVSCGACDDLPSCTVNQAATEICGVTARHGDMATSTLKEQKEEMSQL